jgi:predicted NAD/FAD-dependent oxidoreductase
MGSVASSSAESKGDDRERGSVAVVGSGLSGLWIARELQKRGVPVHVFERHSRIGGRLLTLEHFECAASRLFSYHERALALVRELGLHADEWNVETTFVNNMSPPGPSHALAFQTPFGARVLQQSPSEASSADAGTGYDDHTKLARGRVPQVGRSSFFVREGFSAIVEGVAKAIDPSCIHLNHRVTNVALSETGGYDVTIMNREGEEQTRRFSRVVLALPPHAAREFDCVKRWAKPLLSMLKTVPLHRIYGKVGGVPEGLLKRLVNTRIVSDTPLRQTIGCPPLRGVSREGWVQISYTSGSLATMWQRVWTESTQEDMRKTLQRHLRAVLEEATKTLLPDLVLSDIESHYWEQAVHGWHPPSPAPASIVERKDRIHPHLRLFVSESRCPGLVWAGEAVSEDFHGWIEGALETAEVALKSVIGRDPPTERALPCWGSFEEAKASLPLRKLALMDGNVLDVTDWAEKHPGGAGIIDKYAGTDVSSLWRMYHETSEYGWRSIAALTIGFVGATGTKRM